jgi:hypothetical protein
LNLRELEFLHQAVARFLGIVRGANQLDHGIEIVERDQIAGQDVGSPLGLPKLVLRAPNDYLALEVEVLAHQLE